jgi:hypothetical protein
MTYLKLYIVKSVISSKKKQNQMNLLLKNDSSAFESYESKFITYDINNKGYDGLAYLELSAPYSQHQVNKHGNVTIMVRIKF